jgi:hypothetical protein
MMWRLLCHRQYKVAVRVTELCDSLKHRTEVVGDGLVTAINPEPLLEVTMSCRVSGSPVAGSSNKQPDEFAGAVDPGLDSGVNAIRRLLQADVSTRCASSSVAPGARTVFPMCARAFDDDTIPEAMFEAKASASEGCGSSTPPRRDGD